MRFTDKFILLTRGYLGDPKATREHMLDNGWYKTGDLGYLDAHGFLFVSGRIKDIIKTNGYCFE